jgi:ABC-type transport system substrate-binding protein
LFVGLVVLALIAAACGGDDESTETTAAPTTEATTTTEAMQETTTTEAMTETTAEAMTGLAGLTKVDDYTFTVELDTPDPEFPIQLAYAAYFPLPSVALDDPAGFEEAPIGNGPFMMDGTWNHDIEINTVANPDYAGPDTPQVDSLQFQIYDSSTTAYTEALAGNLDIVDTVPDDFLGTYQDDFPSRNGEALTTSFGYLGFPTYLPQYTKEIRQALSMAVDRELIMQNIFLGARDAAYSVIPPNLQGRDFVCDSWSYDPVKAKELWDSQPDPGPITVWFNSGGGHENWVEAVVNQWGQNLGIDTSTVTFETLEFSEYLPVIDNKELTGPFRLGWGQDYPSPYNFLYPLYHSDNFAPVGSNSTFYDNPDFDAKLDEGAAALAASGQLSDALPYYYEAEDILCDDAQVMPMYFGKAQFVWNEGIDNVFIDSYSDLGYTKVTSDDGAVSTFIVEPEHLFPTTSNESEGIAVLRALFTGLVQFDPETNEPFNANAQSITSDDGGKTWTVVLDPAWTFHNGEPVTADSYINAWNYGADGANGQQNNSFYSNIVGYADLNPDEG